MGEARGGGGPNVTTEIGSHLTSLEVNLVPLAERPFTSDEFAAKWRENTPAIPGLEVLRFSAASGPGAGASVKADLDPARSGAAEVVTRMHLFGPQRIVYVSCHPGTLARDAGTLVNEQGYRLESAGIIDMFPHTAHVESIAVFDKA